MKRLIVFSILILGFVLSIAAGQCQGITRKGRQCRRNASSGSEYCWQHEGQIKNKESGAGKVAASVRTQCKATTRAGHQCKRNAEVGGEYCWQHKRMYANDSSERVRDNSKEDETSHVQTSVEPNVTEPRGTVLGKCQGKTKKGKPCSRKAKQGSNFCWQHQE